MSAFIAPLSQPKKYLLGSHPAEMHRLGLQHQVWAKEAHEAWNRAGFKKGDRILDFGCGPGFCSIELGYRVGKSGRILGLDISEKYIDFLNQNKQLHPVNIDTKITDLHHYILPKNSLDGAWCRWVLAWVEKPFSILENIIPALKKGASLAIQEYYAWDFFRFSGEAYHLNKAVKAAFESFEDTHANINIGAQLPKRLSDYGMRIKSTRPVTILATPQDASWEWPRSFLTSYLPKIVESGYLSVKEVQKALLELKELSKYSQSSCLCPTVVEIIAEKV